MHERDLKDIVSFEGFNVDDYHRDEQRILKPQMEQHGYTEVEFYDEVLDPRTGASLRKCRAKATGSQWALVGAEGKTFYFYYD
jgi:hypothetical protein